MQTTFKLFFSCLFLAATSVQDIAAQPTIIERSIELKVSAISDATFSSDGTKIVATHVDGIRIWDANTGRELRKMTELKRGLNTVRFRTSTFSSDGKKIVAIGFEVGAQIWDADSGSTVRTLFESNFSNLSEIIVSPDGKKIFTASHNPTDRLRDEFVHIWDIETGRAQVLKHTDWVGVAVFSPNGKKVATISDGIVRIWDAESGNELQKFGVNELGEHCVLSHDGARICITWNRMTSGIASRIYDAHSGKELHATAPNSRVSYGFFSPDGKKITRSSDFSPNTLDIVDVDSGKELQKLVGHFGGVDWKATFSPDGKRIVTTSSDTSARIWDTSTGKELQRLMGHVGHIHSATFSPDGKKVVTIANNSAGYNTNDATARIWTLP